MRISVLIVIFALLLNGCEKDKFTTKPQLKYESVNNKVVEKNQLMIITLSFTDKEGDLTDSLYVEQVTPGCPGGGFKTNYKIPDFPRTENQSGEIEVAYVNGEFPGYFPIGGPDCGKNDTCYFRFMLKDKDQNMSDTVNSETIVIVL